MKRLLICLCLSCCLLLAGCAAKDADAGLTIPVDALNGDAAFFDYDAGGTAMQVIARIDDSGVPKLSYNTCQSCAGSPFAYFEV